MTAHDRDTCSICYDDRCLALRFRGLRHTIIQDLRWCGPAGGIRQLRILEAATDDQITQLNRAAR